jgi:hypothetical protein
MAITTGGTANPNPATMAVHPSKGAAHVQWLRILRILPM